MWTILLLFSLLVFTLRRPARKSGRRPEPAFKNSTLAADELVITAEFQEAFNLMENTRNCAYITGKAGTGKSTLLNYFRGKTRKHCTLLAPTGVAAITIQGATINSFFGFSPRLIDKREIKADASRRPLFQRLEMIIIDEISMVRPDVLDGIDYSLRLHRENTRPFGGVQMIFFGDLCQLPPVVTGDLAPYFQAQYGGSYFFKAHVLREIDLQYMELQTVFRQKDEAFKSVLNHIREDRVTAADLALINSRYQPGLKSQPGEAITLATTQQVAGAISHAKMTGLPGTAYVFPAVIKGKITAGSYPADTRLSLKLGAQVMLLKNDPQKRWANGSIGIISEINEMGLSVEIGGHAYALERATWEVIEYAYLGAEKRIRAMVVGSFCQYPVKAAWAITIHKSQGLTFDRVCIDWGAGAFTHGQAYVALSRCRSLEGLVLAQPLRPKDIVLDDQVKEFLQAKRGVSE